MVDQCEYTTLDSAWLGAPTDVVQSFTATVTGAVSGFGFVILTPIGTPSLIASIYDYRDGIIQGQPLATALLGSDYFSSFGVETMHAWGYGSFSEAASIQIGEKYALRLESPGAWLWRSETNAYLGGELLGSPSKDLAFRIYVVPEPSCTFLTLTTIGIAARRKRRTYEAQPNKITAANQLWPGSFSLKFKASTRP